MLLNCGFGEYSWEFFGWGGPKEVKQSILEEINPEYSLAGLMLKLKLQYLANWCKEPTNWKRSWFWERLKARGEGEDRGWNGWMVSLTHWTWLWVNSRRWWRTGKPNVLQSMGSQSQTWLSDWTTMKMIEQLITSDTTFVEVFSVKYLSPLLNKASWR